MAKRSGKRSGRRTTGTTAGGSLVELARRFEQLNGEVEAMRDELGSKERELAAIRLSFAKATGSIGNSEGNEIGNGRPRGRGRRVAEDGGDAKQPRKGSLGEAVLTAMSDGTERGPSDVLAEIAKAGYKSGADPKSRSVMVTQTLAKLSKTGLIRKVGRGRYQRA